MKYTRISTNSTTVLRALGRGTLKRIIIGKKGASSNVLTMYDGGSSSSPVITAIDTTDRVGSIECGIPFENGLTAIMGTGTTGDVTIVWEPL